MDVLFIAPTSNPFIGKGWGSLQRTCLFFEAIARLGNVDVISFQENVVSNRDNCHVLYSHFVQESVPRSRFRQLLNTVFPISPYSLFPKDGVRASVVKSFIEKKDYDFIVCRYLPSAMECGLLDYPSKLIVDIDDSPKDVEISAVKLAGSLRNKAFHCLRAGVIGLVYKTIQSRCLVSFYSNPSQVIYKNSVYLPNIPYYDDEISVADFNSTVPRIIFIGNLSYGPNCRGIDYFIDKVFPHIRKRVPNVELRVVGGCNLTAYIEKWKHVEGVQYMGFVDDLRKEYSECRVVVVPIYEGAGTNIKILEAMKMRRPCVTTQCGFRGFSRAFSPGKELCVSENDSDFATKIVEVLLNLEKNHRISEEAFSSVKKQFSRSVFNSIVENSLINCLK